MGAHVESAEGESLEVVSIKYHVAYELVELIAGAELLQVSPTHRIVIRGPTTVSTKEAKDLELGCQVMCSSGARPLREVRKFQVLDGQPVLSIRCKPSTSTLLRKAQVAGITIYCESQRSVFNRFPGTNPPGDVLVEDATGPLHSWGLFLGRNSRFSWHLLVNYQLNYWLVLVN